MKGEIFKWKMMELIGGGSFGCVFKGKKESNGELIAVKRLVENDQYKKEFEVK